MVSFTIYRRTLTNAATKALIEFAEYVEEQQRRRYPIAPAKGEDTAAGDAPKGSATDHHDELDALFDNLDLSDSAPTTSLRNLLLREDGEEEALKSLQEILSQKLKEGLGETVFELGQEASGEVMKLDKTQWDRALDHLRLAAKNVNADCEVLLTYNVGGPLEAESSEVTVPGKEYDNRDDAKNDVSKSDPKVETKKSQGDYCHGLVMIRKIPEATEEVMETRIAVVGNVDAGKSSMLGVLVKGDLDDGRGSARVNLFRHKHEMETGRTSSVGLEILGFDSKGQVVRSAVPGRKLSWEEIGQRSAKVISFHDLAGHERYLKTTVFGLLASSPNYCLLMVAANNGLVGMSKEHLGIALALNVPVLVVITKIDICPPNILEETVRQITKILRSPGANKIPIFIKSREECINTATHFVGNPRVCPVFQVSNVTGLNLDLVRSFLSILPHQGHHGQKVDEQGRITSRYYDIDAPLEYHINEVFSVPFVGTVVSGILKAGVIQAHDPIWIGPNANGQFTPTVVRSIERKRISVSTAYAGQSVSIALKKVRSDHVRKGMLVFSRIEGQPPPPVYREFVAEVLILSHATTIKHRYQAMLHVGSTYQTCSIIDLDRPFIRTGDRATVAFRFMQRPEYLAPGDRLIFREGRTKGLGIVKEVGYDSSRPLSSRPQE